MKEFFHVSRTDLSKTKEFILKNTEGNISAEEFYTAEEFTLTKNKLFPNGISRHGEYYLHNPFISDGPNLAFTKNELILETTFDLVRQLNFPNKISRFECVFGCLNLEDAKKLKNQTFNGIGEIYKVSCEDYIIADMNLVRQAGSIIGL